jgi:hypothetical protein
MLADNLPTNDRKLSFVVRPITWVEGTTDGHPAAEIADTTTPEWEVAPKKQKGSPQGISRRAENKLLAVDIREKIKRVMKRKETK